MRRSRKLRSQCAGWSVGVVNFTVDRSCAERKMENRGCSPQ